jgi:heat shock protein HslJ
MHRSPAAAVALVSAMMLQACSSEPAWVRQEKAAQTSPASLQGATWICVGLDAKGADPREPLSLEFQPEGRLQGFAGVNRFGGTWSAGEGVLEIGSLVATKMAGPQQLMDLERRFLDALSQVRGFSLQGGLLRLKDGGGRIVLEFSR